MKIKPYLFAPLIFLVFSSSAFGFGEKAHRVIGQVTEQLLSETTRHSVHSLLGSDSLAEASVWADEMRFANSDSDFWGYDHSAAWHFVNIDPGKSYSQQRAASEGDAYQAVIGLSQLLKDEPISQRSIRRGLDAYNDEYSDDIYQNKVYSLKLLIHFIEDLHQPMHVGYAEDRGGNDVSIRWEGRNINLHSLWDTYLLSESLQNEDEFAEELLIKINKLSPEERQNIMEASPEQWLDEGLILRDEVYASVPLARSNSETYREEYTDLLEAQMLKAVLRLAYQLNAIFE